MAGLAIEMAEAEGVHVPIEIIPGVTAASAAAAALGAPLMLDFAVISLSDLLVPWETIRRRLQAVAQADLVVALYNPRSKKRERQLQEAVEIFREFRPAETPVGVATAAGQSEQSLVVTDLEHVLEQEIGMRSVVIVGNSSTRRDRRLAGHRPRVPTMILLLGGTSDVRQIAARLIEGGHRVLVSQATDVPLEMDEHPNLAARSGPLDDRGLESLVESRSIRAIVDATHPYATAIRTMARRVAASKGVPYLSFVRPPVLAGNATGLELAADHAAAARAAFAHGRPVLLDDRCEEPRAVCGAIAADGPAAGGTRVGPSRLAGGLPPGGYSAGKRARGPGTVFRRREPPADSRVEDRRARDQGQRTGRRHKGEARGRRGRRLPGGGRGAAAAGN